jgi:hypothetical protein
MWATVVGSLLMYALSASDAAIGERAFGRLRAGYAARDAAVAASAYAPTAVVTYRYTGVPVERYRGRTAIRGSFQTLFDQIDTAQALDLDFRITSRRGRTLTGFYRLRIGTQQVTYGEFLVQLDRAGRFTHDVSRQATSAQFDGA